MALRDLVSGARRFAARIRLNCVHGFHL